MKLGDYTEDEFYDMVEEGMESAIDHVASLNEWMTCKRALARWVAKIDSEMDRFAQDQEHEIE